VGGISVHANVAVPARDRKRLERLCRYAARPPIAADRLSIIEDGRVIYMLKRRYRDGTTHVLFEPQEFMEKLAALVPPPRFNLVRYHGVLAPAARLRARIVPNAPDIDGRGPHPGCEAAKPHARTSPSGEGSSPTRRTPRTRNSTWAELMRRVFAVDVLECWHCHGRMRILAAIHPPDTTRKILEHLGLPSRAPPIAPAVSEPEPAALEADFID